MITIRPAIQTDLPQILEIYNDIIVNTTAVYDYKPHTLEMRTLWFTQRAEQGFPIFVAEEGNSILGFSSFGTFRPWAAFKYSVENSVYVAPPARGKGISKLLLEALVQKAKELNIHTIIAGIDATNEVSIRLHQGFGFEKAGIIQQAGYKFGRWLDLLFMQLILETPEYPTEE